MCSVHLSLKGVLPAFNRGALSISGSLLLLRVLWGDDFPFLNFLPLPLLLLQVGIWVQAERRRKGGGGRKLSLRGILG